MNLSLKICTVKVLVLTALPQFLKANLFLSFLLEFHGDQYGIYVRYVGNIPYHHSHWSFIDSMALLLVEKRKYFMNEILDGTLPLYPQMVIGMLTTIV